MAALGRSPTLVQRKASQFSTGGSSDTTLPSAASRESGAAASRPDLIARLNSLCLHENVFSDAGDDIVHVVGVLRDRCMRPDDVPSAQLAFLCDRYVARFAKRMEILQKRGGESRDMALSSSHWAPKLKTLLNRPFASKVSFVYYCFISILVVSSCIALVLQTIPSFNPDLYPDQQTFWNSAEYTFAGLLFTDWIGRLIAATFEPNGETKGYNFRSHVTLPSTMLDLAACTIPGVLSLAGDPNGAFQIFTLLRVFRMFSSLRHFDAFEDLEDTIRGSLASLTGPFIALMVVLVSIASLVYTVEAGSYNDQTMMFMVRHTDCEMGAQYQLGLSRCVRTESLFLSVIHTMWYTLITFLTVGYGDLVPVSAAGRSLGALSIIVGMLFMAMPIAIVGTNFTFTVDRLRMERLCVLRLMEERAERVQRHAEVQRVEEAKRGRVSVPAQALLRFLRLNMRVTHVDFAAASKRFSYFVDVFLFRVAHQLVENSQRPFLGTLAMRATERRNPYNGRLALVPCTALKKAVGFPRHVSVPINVPLTLWIGGSPRCHVCVPYDILRRWTTLDERAVAPAPTPRSNQSVNFSVAPAKPRVVPFLADLHVKMTLVGYGGTMDTLTATPVDGLPFAFFDADGRETTMLGNAKPEGRLYFHRPNTPMGRSGEPPPGFHLRVAYGIPFAALQRASLTVVSNTTFTSTNS